MEHLIAIVRHGSGDPEIVGRAPNRLQANALLRETARRLRREGGEDVHRVVVFSRASSEIVRHPSPIPASEPEPKKARKAAGKRAKKS